MPRAIRRISAIVYGLGIVGALTFGANQALGRAVTGCIYKPPALLGDCIYGPDSLQDCRDRCGEGYTGDCVTVYNCCECFAR
jgi:hypothetical protein